MRVAQVRSSLIHPGRMLVVLDSGDALNSSVGRLSVVYLPRDTFFCLLGRKRDASLCRISSVVINSAGRCRVSGCGGVC